MSAKQVKLQITRNDVVQAAAQKGIPVLQALTMMQAAAARMSDESTLRRLCEIKHEMIFGD